MSVLDRKYMLRLDLSKQKNNTEMEFNISDNQTSDFSVKITHKGKPVDLTDSLGLLVVTKPSGKVEIAEGQIIETSSVYFNLQNNCKDEVGIYSAYVVLGHTYQDIIDDKDRVLLGQITYVVNNDTVQELQPLIPGDDNFQIMIDIITRLQELESNENARILAEQLRVQAEQARVAEHNSMIETFDTKVEEVESTIASVVATEQGIKEAEAIRVTSENTRINNETDRQHTESDRVVAEKKRVVEHDSMMDSTTVAIANINSTDGSIKEAESKRVLAEQQRVDAENIREQAIEKVKTDIVKLINDTNKKIDDYKLEKDTAIQQDLEEYKSTTTQDIQDYKKLKDTEINKNLSDYKTSTTTDINNYKSAKDRELDNYKTEKDLEIDTYIETKNLELDKYVAAKNDDIDNYKNSKDTLINNKLEEVDTAEQSRVEAEQQRVTDHTERETFLNSFESQLGQIETKNVEQDNRLNSIEYVNKRQDVVLGGLLNEGGDNRLSITSEGNSVKLEHSKDGIIEVEKVVGNTMCTSYYDNTLPILKGSSLSLTHRFHYQTIRCRQGKLNDIIYYRINLTLNKLDVEPVRSLGVQTHRDNGGYNIAIQQFKISDVGKTLDISATRNIDANCTQLYNGMSIGLNGELPEGATNGVEFCNFTIHDYVAVNLTEIFGSGNEPTKEWCDKNIPYFEGMQSTFEDKLVTQEMVDSGLEKAENLGKYKANVKVVGKNLFDATLVRGSFNYTTDFSPNSWNECWRTVEFIPIKGGTNYKCSYKYNGNPKLIAFYFYYDSDYKIIGYNSANTTSYSTSPSNACYCRISSLVEKNYDISKVTNVQLEEGTVATPYEPYKESKQVLYLDEPLYKDNELCIHNGQLGYWKKSVTRLFKGGKDEQFILNDANAGVNTLSFQIPLNLKVENGTDILNTFAPSLSSGLSQVDYEGVQTYNDNFLIRINKNKLSTQDSEGLRQHLQVNNVQICFNVLEPIFVPILENTPQWILDSYNSCTVHFETNVPILSSSFKYTGNVPSVYGMEKSITDIEEQNVDLMHSIAYISKALNILGGEEV